MINLINFLDAGIIGTKEYRKPEWVTHMEELSEALKGKHKQKNNTSTCMSLMHVVVNDESVSSNYSIDSLEKSAASLISDRFSTAALILKTQTNQSKEIDDDVEDFENYPLTKGLSNISVQSEPMQKLKQKQGFIQNAMDDYLNSHRHSLSSVMELIGIDERQFSSIESQVDRALENKDVGEITYYSEEEGTEEVKDCGNYYYTLSPIEENSEPSTGSSTLKETISKEIYPSQLLSSSFDPIPSEREELDEKCQTFPRSKNTIERYAQMNEYSDRMMMYPLEPRELDPCAFNQLHTVDSQEELQEFLLLESECMSDIKGRGLATAFVDDSNDDDDDDVTKQQ